MRTLNLIPVLLMMLFPIRAVAFQEGFFDQATLVCKVKMGTFTENEAVSSTGMKCDAVCDVISSLKGEAGKTVQITFRRGGSGPAQPDVDAVKAGETYVVLLQGETPPYRMFAALKAVAAVVEPTFGTTPGDRLLAELVAAGKSDDARMRIAAVEQMGIMRDARGSKQAEAAAQSKDDATARAGLIAQYRMRIAPDAKRVMELFDQEMLDVWYQESGIPQKDAKGQAIWRREGGHAFLERGVPDFDYATYVREGIKKDWVRKGDDNTLYVFFGIPWKVQRKACVPPLVELLADPDQKVRWWAAECLTHTVEGKEESIPKWGQDDGREKEELPKWRTWWKEKGPAFMAEHAEERP